MLTCELDYFCLLHVAHFFYMFPYMLPLSLSSVRYCHMCLSQSQVLYAEIEHVREDELFFPHMPL